MRHEKTEINKERGKKKKKKRKKSESGRNGGRDWSGAGLHQECFERAIPKGPPGASAGNSQRSFYDDAMGFFHAVAWREEKWLWAVIAFEILLLATILMTKSRWNVQVFLFSLTSALVYFAENLNNFGRSHWRQFSTQDYFDRRGFFASCVLSGPLIFILFVQLITALRTAAK